MTTKQKYKFIDLFSGCGGLSLGLMQAGWQGEFAIEKSPDAFSTFHANFLEGPHSFRFSWPQWLEKKNHSINTVLRELETDIKALRGTISLVAGGPPCQGFSFSGKRNKLDPRNLLFQKYVQFVSDVGPEALVMENVPGMAVVHGKGLRERRARPGPVPKSYYDRLLEALARIGYVAKGSILDAADFGVPQRRPRLIVVGLREDIAKTLPDGIASVFAHIDMKRLELLRSLGLYEKQTAKDAISDLMRGRRKLIPYDGPNYPKGYWAPNYRGPISRFQEIMHDGFDEPLMDSIRLAKHSEKVIDRFKLILRDCRSGVTLSEADRKKLGMSKHRTFVLHPNRPAPTVTTLPDDLLHYKEPRILSVRELARIQSFPDWFKFCGKYTTGGDKRKEECPRFTQVGNAVPPLMARAIGLGVLNALDASERNAIGSYKNVAEQADVKGTLAVA